MNGAASFCEWPGETAWVKSEIVGTRAGSQSATWSRPDAFSQKAAPWAGIFVANLIGEFPLLVRQSFH